LREEIESLRLALSEATRSGNTVDDAAAHFDPELSIDARRHRALPSDEDGFVERSSRAMDELSSLMLQLDVADFGEPSFALTSKKAGDEIHPGVIRNIEPPGAVVLSPTESKQLVSCFADSFDKFHQFLDHGEAETQTLVVSGADEIDLNFRNSAVLAVAASCSDMPRFKNLEQHFYCQAENLALHSIGERPTDLVVQGLALLAWVDLKDGADSRSYNWIGEWQLNRSQR
jgi:hypothetical protein